MYTDSDPVRGWGWYQVSAFLVISTDVGANSLDNRLSSSTGS